MYLVAREHHPRTTVALYPVRAALRPSPVLARPQPQRPDHSLDALFALFCMCSNLNSRVFMRPRTLCKNHPGGRYLQKNAIWNQYVAHSSELKCTQGVKTQQSVQPDRVEQQAQHHRNFTALCFDNDANSLRRNVPLQKTGRNSCRMNTCAKRATNPFGMRTSTRIGLQALCNEHLQKEGGGGVELLLP